MRSDTTRRATTWIRSLALTASGLAFLGFALNVLYGRFAPMLGLDPGLRLARVPEFLLLFASATFFVIAALAAERLAGGRAPVTQPQTPEEEGRHENKQGATR
ncbi:hypothetical protein B1C78_03530 [Thioalkalivibrio denitrificans]|uniref:Uncharacterized protein n=1 Tax=Thioalkalivibrio denitrificans TaxID=108003 RepID=A0A1V3NRF8_9GAMM|nr:hypothetical protein [Thioalkalivibrio denitrificans]OOG27553.1 hypothetical protein B1C78_03530 [Thioalkalivibrio denitrificans]